MQQFEISVTAIHFLSPHVAKEILLRPQLGASTE